MPSSLEQRQHSISHYLYSIIIFVHAILSGSSPESTTSSFLSESHSNALHCISTGNALVTGHPSAPHRVRRVECQRGRNCTLFSSLFAVVGRTWRVCIAPSHEPNQGTIHPRKTDRDHARGKRRRTRTQHGAEAGCFPGTRRPRRWVWRWIALRSKGHTLRLTHA